jgi:hypothetical protein
MKPNPRFLLFICVVALLVLMGSVSIVNTQTVPTHRFLSDDPTKGVNHVPLAQRCVGPISRVVDVGDESVRVTGVNFFPVAGGGGEGGCFDPVPLLTTTVNLSDCTCLNAHLSAIMGSAQTYPVAPMALFQITLTNLGTGAVQHMFGHYETPFGIACPAVALEAERDVDMYASNFFQRVGGNANAGEVPPGQYRVDVWWAGGPPFANPPGAIGAAFVLKLYHW